METFDTIRTGKMFSMDNILNKVSEHYSQPSQIKYLHQRYRFMNAQHDQVDPNYLSDISLNPTSLDEEGIEIDVPNFDPTIDPLTVTLDKIDLPYIPEIVSEPEGIIDGIRTFLGI